MSRSIRAMLILCCLCLCGMPIAAYAQAVEQEEEEETEVPEGEAQTKTPPERCSFTGQRITTRTIRTCYKEIVVRNGIRMMQCTVRTPVETAECRNGVLRRRVVQSLTTYFQPVDPPSRESKSPPDPRCASLTAAQRAEIPACR